MTQKHLWEVEHPYYCYEQNYFSNTNICHNYSNWDEFLKDWGDADPDYNLPFRFDWVTPKDLNEFADEGEKKERRHLLKIFIFLQRKGYHQVALIKVTKKDEPRIKKYLNEKFQYLKKLWEPL